MSTAQPQPERKPARPVVRPNQSTQRSASGQAPRPMAGGGSRGGGGGSRTRDGDGTRFGPSPEQVVSAYKPVVDRGSRIPEIPGYSEPEIDQVVAQFGVQYRRFRDNNLNYPVAQVGDGVPVDILASGLQNSAMQYAERRDLARMRAEAIDRTKQAGLKVIEVAPVTARSSFFSRLREFVGLRIGYKQSRGQPKRRPPHTGDNPGTLPFDVFAHTDGLEVIYTPNIAVRLNRVFGSPTSPVSGSVGVGLYLFGAIVDGHPQLHQFVYNTELTRRAQLPF